MPETNAKLAPFWMGVLCLFAVQAGINTLAFPLLPAGPPLPVGRPLPLCARFVLSCRQLGSGTGSQGLGCWLGFFTLGVTEFAEICRENNFSGHCLFWVQI